MSFEDEYPEHAKLAEVQGNSQTIGLFLDSLPGELRICEPIGDNGYYVPTRMSIEAILAGYYGINLRTLNAEKDAMLAAIRRG